MQNLKLQTLQFQKKSKRKAGEKQKSGLFKFFTSSKIQKYFIHESDFIGPALIFGTGGSASVHYCNEKFSTSTDCFILKSDSDNLDLKYIYYYLSGNIDILERGFHGAGLKHISKLYLSELEIPLPSIQSQKQIIQKLDKLTNLIELRKQSIQKTEDLTKSIFIEMFGDPMLNKKGWEIEPFGNGISLLTDYHANGSYQILNKHVKLLNKKDFAYMVRTTDLENKNYIDGVKYIDEHAYDFLSKSKIYGGEIIINKIGSAGVTYLMPQLNIPASMGMNAFLIKTDNNILLEIFTYYYLKTGYIKKVIEGKVLGAVTKTITKEAVKSIPFYFPPITLQNKFAAIVQKNEENIRKQKESLVKLEKLYGASMQESFSF